MVDNGVKTPNTLNEITSTLEKPCDSASRAGALEKVRRKLLSALPTVGSIETVIRNARYSEIDQTGLTRRTIGKNGKQPSEKMKTFLGRKRKIGWLIKN